MSIVGCQLTPTSWGERQTGAASDDEAPSVVEEQRERASSATAVSDRLWGQLLLPRDAVHQLHMLWSAPPQTVKMLLYGDSHTQGGFIGSAIASEIAGELTNRLAREPTLTLADERPNDETLTSPEAEPLVSPGWVHVAHPIASRARAKASGYWIRQNWLYSSDRGPFGPLGIAYVTQDQSAQLALRVSDHSGVEVSVYFERSTQTLPFCVESIFDAERDDEPTSEAQPREEQARETQASETRTSGRSPRPELPTRACYQRTSNQDDQDDHAHPLDDTLGVITIRAPVNHKVRLTLLKGANIKPSLVASRDRAKRSLKRKRARLKRRKRSMSAEAINRALDAPSYASEPDVILPHKPRLRVYGFYVHEPNARAEMSSLGVRGARIWSPAQQADDSMRAWVSTLKPNIIALWYGTNTAAQENTHRRRYEEQYRAVLQRLKASAPQAVCLVILPPDFGRRPQRCFLTERQRKLIKRRRKSKSFLKELAESRDKRVCKPDELLNLRKRGQYRFPVPNVSTMEQWERYKDECTFAPPALIHELMEIQTRIALEEGCAVYDTFKAMKQTGGIHSWACAESERWAQLDLVHLTPRGYEALGERIAQGLLSVRSVSPVEPRPLGPVTVESTGEESTGEESTGEESTGEGVNANQASGANP